MPLQVRLLTDDKARTAAPAELLDVNPPVRESSSGVDAKPFKLEVSAASPPTGSASPRQAAAPALSGPLTVRGALVRGVWCVLGRS
jgi:hypothetical protein